MSAPDDACRWAQEDDGSDTWWTNCSQGFTFTDGGPKDNGFRFCCYCGKPLVEVEWAEPADEDGERSMTDIVQRLRNDAYALPADEWIERDGSTVPVNSCSIGADEIERMDGKIAALESYIEMAHHRDSGEIERLRADAQRYRWLRARLPGSAYRIAGVIYSEGGSGVDAAIDAAMKGTT